MVVRIGTNIGSLKAQRQLGKAGDVLSTTYERLSSGQRINKASDDAAGLAISSSLSAKSRVYSQALKNVSDGVSLLSVTEGALTQLSDVTIKQRELATQAANGTYSQRQRLALQKESDALVQEHNRIIQSTSFNGRQILDGNFGTLVIQNGFGVAESTTVRIGEALAPAAGDGTFTVAATLSLPSGVGSDVAVADMNGDGIADIVAGSQGGAGSIWLGTSSGSYSLIQTFAPSGGSPQQIELADLNNDGRPDVVARVFNLANSVSIFLNRGDGTLLAPISLNVPTTTQAQYDSSLKLGDFNADGQIDIVSQSSSTGQTSVLLGNGDGSFRTGSVLHSPAMGLVTGDFDNDGNLDLLTANTASVFTLWRGKGDGTFSTSTTNFGVTFGTNNFTAADFNNDGNLDFARNNLSSSFTNVFFGDGKGNFTQSSNLSGNFQHTQLESGDLNGDGLIDLITSRRGAGFSPDASTEIYINNGNGIFSAGNSVPEVTGSQTSGISLADLNNDGILDLLTTHFEGGIVRVLRGNADASGRRNPFVSNFNLLSPISAREGITKASKLLDRITNELGQIGAAQSRLQTVTANLRTTTENYSAARSRIVDADIAGESADLARNNILQQAATAVLAQANIQPQLALRLLRP